MSTFTVDLAALEEFVGSLQAVEGRLASMRDDVDRRVAALQLVWSGRAADEHRLAHRLWATGASDAERALSSLREIAVTATGNYAAAVRANASMWSR